MRRLVAAGLVIAAVCQGCGSPPSSGATPAFAVGEDLIVYDADPNQDHVFLSTDSGGESLSVGTKVRHLDTDWSPSIANKSRRSRVKVMEGQHADLIGTIWTDKLRAAKD